MTASSSHSEQTVWTGPTCAMCAGTGIYPSRTAPGSLNDSGPVRWGTCGACLGRGRDAA